MKITILSGSPRKNGNSVYLARQFMKGAKEAGHEVFFFTSTAQLKKVTDRFFAINDKLLGKKSVFLATMANPSEKVANLALVVYQSIANFLHWKDMGHILAIRLWNPTDIRSTDYVNRAYEFGKNIQ